MRSALAPLTVGRPDLLTLIDAAAGAGFECLGLTLWLPDGTLAPACSDPGLLRAASSLLRESGLAPLDAGVVVLRPDLDMDGLRRFADTAAALGADRLIAMNQDPSPAGAAATLASVCEIAGSREMSVGVEFMPYTATKTLGEARDLVASAGVANGGIILDVLHLFRSGGGVADLASLGGVPVLLLQLCDAPRRAPAPEHLRSEALTDRLYPGTGELPLEDLLAAVPPGVAVTLEAPVAADAGLPPRTRAVKAARALKDFRASVPGLGGGGRA